MQSACNTSIIYATIRIHVCVLSILIFGWAPHPLQAQRSISFERFSTQDGLSNYSITSILQDQYGFLWIGTQAGLNRYDGYTFSHYTAANSDLEDDYINTLYEDQLGIIWIGTQQAGIYSFDPKTEKFTGYAHKSDNPDSLSHNDVRAIHVDQDANVWIGTRGGGLNRLDREKGRFERFTIGAEGHVGDQNVWAILPDPVEPGILWIGTDAGLRRVSSSALPAQPPHPSGTQNQLVQDAVRALYSDKVGVIWVGTRNTGLYAILPGTDSLSQYLHDADDTSSLASNYVLSIVEDQSDRLWIGTHNGGLSRFDRSTGRFSTYQNQAGDPGSLPHNQVYAVLADRAGVIWAGTWGGLGKHVPSHTTIAHYTHAPNDPNSLSHPQVASIYQDRSGLLWIGTLGGGINNLDRQTDRFTRLPVLFEDVISIYEDHSGSLWLGTRGNNLLHLDRQTTRTTVYHLDAPGSEHPDNIVLSIYEAPSEPGILWIGTNLHGIYTFDVRSREATRHFVNDPADPTSLSHNYAWPIYEDRLGSIWVGTWDGGLNRFDRETETFTRYRHDVDDPYSISGDRVISVGEDRVGRLWVGTFGRGLNRFDRSSNRFIRYTERDGLPSNDITGILADDEGHLWLSTNNGISRFEPRNEEFVNFGVADGLQSSIFRIGASHRNEEGELFFGGENGFNVILPERALEARQEPNVVLTNFHLFDRSARLDSSISAVSEITLDYDDNYVGFEFAVLDFTDPSKNQYAYMLEGVDTDWVMAGTQRYVRYPKLSPDTYTFRVKGANSNNVWNEQGASLRLTITPPFWETPWAYTLYLVALLSILFGSYKWRVRSLNERAIELERMVDERTEDLLAEKKKTEEQAEKLRELEQVKDRFFANISHEFRTPLTLILGPVHDALDGAYGSMSPKLRSQLEVMYRQGDRLHRLINQLLDLSKLEIGRMQLRARNSDLITFVKGIVMSFSSLADLRHITLQCHADADHLPIYFDADKLEKVITNLLSNAVKFTPEHGKIWVSIYEVAAADGVAPSALDADRPSGASSVEIQVRDTGRGIPAEELPFIFDRFYQVDTSSTRGHEGTGIGLALTKELVELHGGTIRVESQEGFGTTFFVRLPSGKEHLEPDELAEDVVEEPPDAYLHQGNDAVPGFAVAEPAYGTDTAEVVDDDEVDGEAEPSAPKILIVEDNPDVRAYLKSHLFAEYNVIEASDGEEGLATAREIGPDLVISDVMMPKMDGMELCRALKDDEQLNHIPVILLTAKATDASKIEGLTTGADDYIYKPFNAEELLARVENLIEVRQILRRRFSSEVRIGPTEIAVPSAEAQFLEQAREVVESHMADTNFSADWLAEEVGMSRRHLHRRLKQAAGVSPAGYIRMMRLERAAQLLEQRVGSVSEVAYRVGFKNADHFSRLFQQVFDIPPSQYPPK